MGKIKVCLKCGWIDNGESDVPENCNRCGGNMKESNYDADEYMYQIHYPETKKIDKILRDRYVLSPQNTEFDEDEYYKREDEEILRHLRTQEDVEAIKSAQTNRYTSSPKPDPNACPRCGNTSFTPVRQKWNIFTGFRTNKIDLVCNKCGYVKKG